MQREGDVALVECDNAVPRSSCKSCFIVTVPFSSTTTAPSLNATDLRGFRSTGTSCYSMLAISKTRLDRAGGGVVLAYLRRHCRLCYMHCRLCGVFRRYRVEIFEFGVRI